MAKKFYIDQEECVGDGGCARICPECFKVRSRIDAAQVMKFDCDENLIQKAIDQCPAQCIHWKEEEK